MHTERLLILLGLVIALTGPGCGDDGSTAAVDTGGSADVGPDSTSSADPASDVAPGVPDAAPDAWDAEAGPQFVCEGHAYDQARLLPGPCEPGFDPELDAKARRFDRVFHALSAAPMGVNTDTGVSLDATEDRALVESFAAEHDGWDFEAYAGKSAKEVLNGAGKATGMYAGAGIMADAYRYATMKDQGYPQAELDIAREHLLVDIEVLHIVVDITGVEGVIARSIDTLDWPGGGGETVPMFDVDGAPLPPEKDNGTWREDQTGQYPDLVWEDSISRDMLSGWAMGYAGVWEVIRDDPTFDQALKDRMQADAKALGHSLMKVAESGYDLEVPDADGRRTFHGCMHEHNIDCQLYLDSFNNGFHSLMALAVVGTWAWVSEDPTLQAYLDEQLIGARRLHELARDDMFGVYAFEYTNFSGVNMAFISAWLACRVIDDAEVRSVLEAAVATSVYAIPGEIRQPAEQKNPFYDFAYAACVSGQSVSTPPAAAIDQDAVDRGLETLTDFPDAPYWDVGIINCPDATCDSSNKWLPDDQKVCTAVDGTQLDLYGCLGWNDDLIAVQPIPMAIRGPSNYHWRSNPYAPNRGGGGGQLLPGVDFRAAYWMGRWARR